MSSRENALRQRASAPSPRLRRQRIHRAVMIHPRGHLYHSLRKKGFVDPVIGLVACFVSSYSIIKTTDVGEFVHLLSYLRIS
jgi:hypothetical protein